MFIRADGFFHILSAFAYCLLSRTSSTEALLFFFARIRTRRVIRIPWFGSCGSLTCISFIPGNKC
jgi:hypothetical protein